MDILNIDNRINKVQLHMRIEVKINKSNTKALAV